MSFKFRKIFANDPLFIKTKEMHKGDYDYFKKYAEILSERSGRVKASKSGKGHSYANYLIRLVVLYQELFEYEVNNLLTFTTLKEIEKVVHSENFKKYNSIEDGFPNAAFNCYLSCVTHLNSEKEEIVDFQTNKDLETTSNKESNNKISTIINSAHKRKDKITNGDVLTYPRNKEENLEAKRRSNWQCELDLNHTTFMNNSNKKPYIEAHHLIPMGAQDYFENTLDFADNIVCLCPNCHRKIHHAMDGEKKEAVSKLFTKRENRYNKYGVYVDLKKLLSFYEIV